MYNYEFRLLSVKGSGERMLPNRKAYVGAKKIKIISRNEGINDHQNTRVRPAERDILIRLSRRHSLRVVIFAPRD